MNVTSHGRLYLGAPIGTRAFVESVVKNKVNQWISELGCLATIAKTQPHAAHSAFTHGLSSEWSYIARTTPDLGTLFQPLEDVIRMKLIPGVTNRPLPNDGERNLLALPARHGGITMTNSAVDTDSTFSASATIARPLKDAILSNSMDYPYEVLAGQLTAKSNIHHLRHQQSNQLAIDLKQNLPDSLKSHGPCLRKGCFQLANYLTD